MLAHLVLQETHPLALVGLEAREVTQVQLAPLWAGRCQMQEARAAVAITAVQVTRAQVAVAITTAALGVTEPQEATAIKERLAIQERGITRDSLEMLVRRVLTETQELEVGQVVQVTQVQTALRATRARRVRLGRLEPLAQTVRLGLILLLVAITPFLGERVALVEQVEQAELAGQVGLAETLVSLATQGVKVTQG